jgi:LuxR family maltose regulon positive regulatory protein
MLTEALPNDAFLLSLISSLASTGFIFAGRFDEAREAARIFYKHLPPGHTKHESFLTDVVIGNSYLTEGRIRDAVAHLMPFKNRIVLSGKVGPEALANTIGSLCESLFQFNFLADARELLDTYSEIISTAELPNGILSGLRVRAHLELLAGNSQEAFQTMLRLEEIGIQRRLDRLVAWSLYDQFTLAVNFQHLTSSEELLNRLSLLAEKYTNYQYCSWAEIPMIYALAIAENALYREVDVLQCISLIEDAEQRCKKTGSAATLVHLGFMRCIARLNAGKQSQALTEASELLKKAAELGALRALVNVGAIGQPLAKMLVSRAQNDAEHQILEIALGRGIYPDISNPLAYAETIAEPLTAREQEVLELLGKGFSAKSIGRSLDISPTTAKWHLKNLYGKLDATSREDALSKARQHRIIN